MIISRTPFRISFFGGGTDYPVWYRQHGGAVLATTIDKYCYLTCRYLPPFFDHRIRVVYSKIETCQKASEITHPAVRAVLGHLGISRGVEIHHDGDLPARSGMGSSSAFTVGLLNALQALKGTVVSKHALALESIHLEQEMLKETVGSQDQVCAAYGGLNLINFLANGEVVVNPVTISAARSASLNAQMMLYYTGIQRTASEVAESYVGSLENKRKQLGAIQAMVEKSLAILNSQRDLSAFGELLHEAWMAKRSLGERVSTPHLDGLYERAITAGALGGKLTGAGGGGFLLLFVPPERQDRVKAAMQDLLHVPFKFDFSGSRIIFYDPESEYLLQEEARDAKLA